MKIPFISFTALVFAILFFFSSIAEADQSFKYNLYWSGIKAGEAVLEYVETPEGLAIRTHAASCYNHVAFQRSPYGLQENLANVELFRVDFFLRNKTFRAEDAAHG